MQFENIEFLDKIRDRIDYRIESNHLAPINKNFLEANLIKACGNCGMKFNIEYITLAPNQKTFVMACYPDYQELERLSGPMMNALNNGNTQEAEENWNKIRSWHIEIDKRLLTPGTNLTVDSGSQFVAIICHELGHIMNSSTSHLVRCYNKSKAQMELVNKMMLSNAGKIVLTMTLPMFVCVNGLKIIVSKPGVMLDEFNADKQVPDSYKSALIDYANNHIIPYPEGNGIIITDEEYDNQQSAGVEFSRNCISLMKKRSASLKFYLNTFGKLNPSPYISEMGSEISKVLTPEIAAMESFTYERFDREYNTALKQANTVMESSNVSERDIALLQVDVDAMKTIDDKTYVLNMIFDYLEILEKQREKTIKKINDPNKIPDSVINDPMIKQLQDMKKRVMSTKITNYIDYSDTPHVYIKYPKGYEG